MRKSDVDTYCDRWGSAELPAINVKVYRWPIDADDLMAKFGCSEKTAEKALEFSWESARQSFWDQAQGLATEALGNVSVYASGRSGGWLTVVGLPPVESWDAVQLAKWSRFTKWIKGNLDYFTSRETVLEDIEVNEWAKDGAEMYNFVDRDGKKACIADLKAEAIKAGFGAVVR